MKNLTGLCERCKKNKATLQYTQSVTDFAHGFVENICLKCYNKIKKSNTWYKEGKKDKSKEIKRFIEKERDNGNLINQEFGFSAALCLYKLLKELEK
jgi:protein-arginine kinase activator protein McsA